MRLNEIDPIAQSSVPDDDVLILIRSAADPRWYKFRRIATIGPLAVAVDHYADHFVVFDKKKPVAYLTLCKDEWVVPGLTGMRVCHVGIDPAYRHKGLGPALYKKALWHFGRGIGRLFADKDQTPGGHRIWARLARDPEVDVYEYRDGEIRRVTEIGDQESLRGVELIAQMAGMKAPEPTK